MKMGFQLVLVAQVVECQLGEQEVAGFESRQRHTKGVKACTSG